MPFPLMMEQEGIVVGVIDAPGWEGEGFLAPGRPTPDPVVTASLLRALADKIEQYAGPGAADEREGR